MYHLKKHISHRFIFFFKKARPCVFIWWRRLRTGEPEVKANEEDWLKEQSGVLEVVEDGVAVVDEVAEAHRPSGIENLNIRVAS